MTLRFKKGEIISHHEPSLIIRVAGTEPLLDMAFCQICGKPVQSTTTGTKVPGYQSLPHFDEKITKGVESEETCTYCCSPRCYTRGLEIGSSFCHDYYLSAHNSMIHGEDDDLLSFFRSLKSPKSGVEDDTDLASFIFAAWVYRTVLQHDAINNDEPKHHIAILYASQCFESMVQTTGQNEIDDNVLECWVILRNKFDNKKDSILSREITKSPTFFQCIYKKISNESLYKISIRHPISNYIKKKLLHLSGEELSTALKVLDMLVTCPPTMQDESTLVNDKGIDTLRNQNFLEWMKKEKDSDDLRRWRLTVRLVQAISDSTVLDDEYLNDGTKFSPSTANCRFSLSTSQLNNEYFVFCPNISLEHSCVPNCLVEGSAHHWNGDESQIGSVGASLVALCDVKGNVLTASKISDLGGNLNERQELLREIYGPTYLCQCKRCHCERYWDRRDEFIISSDDVGRGDGSSFNDSPLNFHWTDMKRMGDLAMQQGRYKDASDLYTMGLKALPSDEGAGDMLHARAASFMERELFVTAQNMWREANEMCPVHREVLLHVSKQKAYDLSNVINYDSSANNGDRKNVLITKDMYHTAIKNQCFITKDEHPLFSREECERVIELAEEHESGWTKNRHYAVPTTDIPVHEIPELLTWFKSMLATRLRPLVALQFGEDEVGAEGCNIYINDAFVVRYDAKLQKHLPLHRDQSTHSFTIALNSTEDYEGGGTFVVSLGAALNPLMGGVLSFRGDSLLHGADPVIRGRRYVLVAFCYVSSEHTKKSRIHPSANASSNILKRDHVQCIHNTNESLSSKRKKKNIMRSVNNTIFQKSTNEDSFSFGFNV